MRVTLKNVRDNLLTAFNPGMTNDQKNAVINTVLEWIITSGEWRGSIQRVAFVPYLNTITLPWNLDRIDQAVTTNEFISVRNQWYEFSPSGPGLIASKSASATQAVDQGEGFVTFQDIVTPSYLKITTEVAEVAGAFNFRGYDANDDWIYTGSPQIQGVNLTIANNAQTTQVFTSLKNVVKPVSNGRISLYAVDISTGVNTLLAIYNPGETVISYRRYALAGAVENDVTTHPDTRSFVCMCKLGYQPLTADNDEVIPSNLNALECGIRALNYRRNADFNSMRQFFAECIDILNKDLGEYLGQNEGYVRMQMGANAFTGRNLQ